MAPASMDEATSASVKPGDLLASKYRVERILGQGSMGVVVAARHEQLGFAVALKFMLPVAFHHEGAEERFLREARAAGRLRSEHVARVMDFGTLDDGAPYIVMEFLEGNDLQQVLEDRGRLPASEAVEYVLQACKGMEEAHAQGIVHRDLKPQNLFLTRRPDGTPLVKVLDFGISKLIGGDAQSLSMTSSAALLGSPLYMAPEQIRSSKSVDARADVYSLGVILYQLLTGTFPIVAESLGDLFEQVFTKTIPPVLSHAPDVPAELDAVVMRCLGRTPETRFTGAGELAAALLPFADPRRSGSGFVAAPPAAGPIVPATVAAAGTSTTLGHAAAVSERAPRSVADAKGSRVAWWGGGVAAVLVVATTSAVLVRARTSPAADTVAAPAASPLPVAPVVAASASAVAASGTPAALSSASASASAPASLPTATTSASAAVTVKLPSAGAASGAPPIAAPSRKPPAKKPTRAADPFASPD
jgi:serine/threonine-protein kinase